MYRVKLEKPVVVIKVYRDDWREFWKFDSYFPWTIIIDIVTECNLLDVLLLFDVDLSYIFLVTETYTSGMVLKVLQRLYLFYGKVAKVMVGW